MTDFEVRSATAEDADAVRDVATETWCAAYDDILDAETVESALDAWYAVETLRGSLDSSGSSVAVADGRVVGYARGVDEGDTAELGALYVRPDRWGEGVGTALCDAFEARCRRADCDAVRLHVLAANDRARGFYAQRDYEAVDELDADLFGEPVAELVLSKALAD